MANTASVAFGSIGIPVTTLAGITGLPVLPLSAMVGRLSAMISIVIMLRCAAGVPAAAGASTAPGAIFRPIPSPHAGCRFC